MSDPGFDGTQPPPPARLFDDPCAGLVTGEVLYRPRPVAPPPVFVASEPFAVDPPAPRRQNPPRRARPQAPHSYQPIPLAQAHVPARQPAQFQPAAPPPGRVPQPPRPQPPRPQPPRPEQFRPPQFRPPPPARQPAKKSGGGALVGCLIALGVLGSLLYPVIREIIATVADLFR
ncbi:hypothetical protein [Actinosynnema sp. NPDC020468]|uniref:hypothetical protein n=1 Tax=Actinosynnema sp. NPDC020468 TaxID=3154488 RepID=UPI0033E66702